MKIVRIIFLFVLWQTALFGQSKKFSISVQTIENKNDYLTRNILCFAKDKNGFMWFGGRDGLFRYDGQDFINFGIKNGLRDKKVVGLVADENNHLLITYSSLGEASEPEFFKDVIDCSQFTVTSLSTYYKNLPFNEKDIAEITKTGEQIIFNLRLDNVQYAYSTAKGFSKLPQKKVSHLYLILENGQLKELKPNEALSLKDNEARLALYSDSTLNIQDGFYSPLDNYSSYCRLVYRQAGGYLINYKNKPKKNMFYYFLSFDGKMYKTEAPEEFKKIDIKKFTNRQIHQHSLLSTEDGRNYFYHQQLGLIPINSDNKKLALFDYYELSPDFFWFTSSDGLIKMQINNTLFNTKYYNRKYDNSARGMYVSQNFSLFNFGNYVAIVKGRDSIDWKQSYCLSVSKVDSDLWIGSTTLIKYSMKNNQAEKMPLSFVNQIWAIGQLNAKELLLGTIKGSFIFNTVHKSIRKLETGAYPESRFVYKFFHTQAGQFWMVADNGIYVLNDSARVIDFYSNSVEQSNRHLPCKSIHDVYEDKEGIFWIASNNEGLFKWNLKTNGFEQFGTNEGFLSNTLYGILEDNQANLWISTYQGLSRFNKKTHETITFTEKDGITNNEFNRISFYKDEQGYMYFGSINGITTLHPNDEVFKKMSLVFPFKTTQVSQFNNRSHQLENIMTPDKITITDNIAYVDIGFALLDFDTRIYRYAYKFDGLDVDWRNTKENSIRLSNMPYGTYTLHIKAQTKNGSWSRQEIVIPVEVLPPFYKTKWFYALLIFALLVGLYFFISARLNKFKKENEKLALKIEEHTAQIRREKLELEKSNEIITNQNREKDALIQEVHHRVKNNLQLVVAMLELQTDLNENEIIQTALRESSRRINAMTLVHEMLYKKDKFESISLKEYLQELIEKLHEMLGSENSGVKFTLNIEPVTFNISASIAIGLITSEIVSNSVKYAFAGVPNPTLDLQLKKQPDNNSILFVIKDNGCGLKANNKQGLGLKLIDIFSRQLKGSYTIKNEKGLMFIFEIPLKANER